MRRSWLVVLASLTTTGCLLFTSVDDLGPSSAATLAANVDCGETADSSSSDAAAEASPGPNSFVVEAVGVDAPGTSGIALDKNTMFVLNSATNKILSFPRASAGPSAKGSPVIADLPAPGGDLVTIADRLFWIFAANPTVDHNPCVMQAQKDGSLQVSRAGFCSATRAIAAGDTLLVVGEGNPVPAGIMRIPVASTDFENLPTTTRANSLTYDGKFIYYGVGTTVYRREVSGSPEIFVIDQDVRDMASDGKALFWLTQGGSLNRLDVDKVGDTPTELAKGLAGPQRLTILDDDVFVTAAGLSADQGRVVSVPKAGGTPVDVATKLADPYALTVDAAGVYWVNRGDGTIMRVRRRP